MPEGIFTPVAGKRRKKPLPGEGLRGHVLGNMLVKYEIRSFNRFVTISM